MQDCSMVDAFQVSAFEEELAWMPPPSQTDRIGWAASQTSDPALNKMIMEVQLSKKKPRQLKTNDSTFRTIKPSSSSSSLASTSGIRPRKRLSRAVKPGSASASAPVSQLLGDPTDMYKLVQGVTAQIGENSLQKKRFMEKRKVQNLTEESQKRHHVPPVHQLDTSNSQELLDRTNVGPPSESGKASLLDATNRTFNLNKQELHSTNDAGQAGHSVQMEVDPPIASTCTSHRPAHPAEPSVPRTIAQRHHPPRQTHSSAMPPPPGPIVQPSHRKPSFSTASSSTSASRSNVQSSRQPLSRSSSSSRVCPPDANSTAKTRCTPQTVLPPPPSPPVVISSQPPALRASQPTAPRPTPPPLGMRRAHTYNGSSSTTMPAVLPVKQKGFKPPFAKPPAPGTSVMNKNQNAGLAKVQLCHTSSTGAVRPPVAQAYRAQEIRRSPSPPPDADSSYGEISFDADLLDEVMQEYD